MTSNEPIGSFERSDDHDRFSEWLRGRSTDAWESMLDHRFVRECTEGSVDDRVYEMYLKQEYAFVETSATALGYTVGKAPTMEQMRHLAGALDGLVTDQRAYFAETFDALGVEGWEDPDPLPATRHFRDLVLRSATGGGYAESLAPMLAAEWLYATWCERAAAEGSFDPETPVGRWIRLHDDEEFRSHARWLRDELDRLGPQLPRRRQRDIAYIFRRTLEHEIRFHEAPYEVV